MKMAPLSLSIDQGKIPTQQIYNNNAVTTFGVQNGGLKRRSLVSGGWEVEGRSNHWEGTNYWVEECTDTWPFLMPDSYEALCYHHHQSIMISVFFFLRIHSRMRHLFSLEHTKWVLWKKKRDAKMMRRRWRFGGHFCLLCNNVNLRCKSNSTHQHWVCKHWSESINRLLLSNCPSLLIFISRNCALATAHQFSYSHSRSLQSICLQLIDYCS